MRIAHLNKIKPPASIENEVSSLFLNTILAKHNYVSSTISHEIILYIKRDKIKDFLLVQQLQKLIPPSDEFMPTLIDIEANYKRYLKYLQLKNKDKKILEFIHRYKSLLNEIRKVYEFYITDRLGHFKVWELVKFYEEPCWELTIPLYDFNEKQESVYIKALEEIISSKIYILSFDRVVEQLFTFTNFAEIHEPTFDYIKIPLWHFPDVTEMVFAQLKYTHSDLNTALISFNEHYYACLEQLFDISFSKENYQKIVDFVGEEIMPFQESMQQAIDNSLYISQLRNKTQNAAKLIYNLGITSIENLIHYHERAELVEPYVATEMKNRLKRTMNLEATCVFSYVTGTKTE